MEEGKEEGSYFCIAILKNRNVKNHVKFPKWRVFDSDIIINNKT